jgi:hypothetical protein
MNDVKTPAEVVEQLFSAALHQCEALAKTIKDTKRTLDGGTPYRVADMVTQLDKAMSSVIDAFCNFRSWADQVRRVRGEPMQQRWEDMIKPPKGPAAAVLNNSLNPWSDGTP